MPFYHGSRKAFPRGWVLVPQPDGYVNEPCNRTFEALVEKLRPTEKLSRNECVFLCDDPDMIDNAGGYSDCIYRVRPDGPTERSDLAWYSDAWCLFNDNPDSETEVARLIELYWSGTPYSNASRSCPEYRTKAATVRSVVARQPTQKRIQVRVGYLPLKDRSPTPP